MYVKVGASDELLPARSGLTSQIDLVCYGPHALCTLTAELPSGAIYIMTLVRSKSGINKVESVRMMVTRERSGNGMRMSGSGPID